MFRVTLATVVWSLVLSLPVVGQQQAASHDRTDDHVRSIPRPSVENDWVRISDGPEMIRIWEGDQGGSYYAVSIDGKTIDAVRKADHLLKLTHVVFDPRHEQPAVDPLWVARSNNTLDIVQFHTQPLSRYARDLKQMGVQVYQYVPHQAFIMHVPSHLRDAVDALPYVRSRWPLHPAFKLSRALAEQLYDGSVTTDEYNIMVVSPNNKAAVAEHITEMTGQRIQFGEQGVRIRAQLDQSQLLQVAHLDDVWYVEVAGTAIPAMDLAREIGGANYLELDTPEGFSGQGVRGEVAEFDMHLDHTDFQDPPVLMHGSALGSFDYNNLAHGTSTFGILFGSGVGQPAARGMLPDAERKIYADTDAMFLDRYSHTAELLEPPYEAVFQNNSWGTIPLTVSYTSQAYELDDIILHNDIVICHSHGNFNDDGALREAFAKNSISVGGIDHNNTLDKADDGPSVASSGYNVYGQIKPDLVHFYDNVRCTAVTAGLGSTYTTSFSGTSASSSIVCGYFGLLFQMWHEQVFNGRGGAGSVFASRPHASTAKAMMICSAQQYEVTSDFTREDHGWGMPNVRKLYDNRDNMLIWDEDVVLRNLESTTFFISVQPGEPELRMTMVYTDVPGTLISSSSLVNDLSLRVTSPSGLKYVGSGPWIVLNEWSCPGTFPLNTKDTVENVFVKDPEPGRWEVEVIATEINSDGHLETPEVDADFALVIIGSSQYLDLDCPVYAGLSGGDAGYEVSSHGATAGEQVVFYSGTANGTEYVPLCDDSLDIATPTYLGHAIADADGTAILDFTLPISKNPNQVFQALTVHSVGDCSLSPVRACPVKTFSDDVSAPSSDPVDVPPLDGPYDDLPGEG